MSRSVYAVQLTVLSRTSCRDAIVARCLLFSTLLHCIFQLFLFARPGSQTSHYYKNQLTDDGSPSCRRKAGEEPSSAPPLPLRPPAVRALPSLPLRVSSPSPNQTTPQTKAAMASRSAVGALASSVVRRAMMNNSSSASLTQARRFAAGMYMYSFMVFSFTCFALLFFMFFFC